MIAELTQDLINKISAIPAIAGRVGATVGGTEVDPTMSEAPTPCAWVMFASARALDNDGFSRRTNYDFAAVVVIGYGSDLLATQYQVLDDIGQAIAGTSGHQFADKWEFQGADLKKVSPGRLVFQLDFSCVGHHRL